MITLKNFEEEIIGIIANHVGVEASSINRETHLAADLGVDSMSMAVLIMKLESYFLKTKDRLPVDYMQEFLGIETVGELIDTVLEGTDE